MELVSSWVNTLEKVIKQFRFVFRVKTIESSDILRISITGQDLKRELTYFQKCLEL